MRVPALILSCALALSASERPIDFSLQIRPLLSEKCFSCHGPDEAHREAKLRLDEEVSAKAVRKDGAAIVPGKPEQSQAWARIITRDADDVMPPPDTHRTLSASDRELIRRWIAQGAPWGTHWAFAPLARVDAGLPSGSAAIDALAGAQRVQHGLSTAPSASLHLLARRLALDLTGLPPTPEQADALASASDRQAALQIYVDGLLASPAFGEHWGRLWLDLARYADTKGYEKDLARDMWLYRDWVIGALNADMPFDQFTIEQLAGDLLPQATQSQIIATGFHRNTMTNDEGGTDNEEFRIAAVKDRVDTTGQVWLGLSVGCAKCHSHKYDPISQEDYYRFFAVFDQTEDADRGDDNPRLSLPTPEQETKRKDLDHAVSDLRKELEAARKDDPTAVKREDSAPEDTPVITEIKKRLKAAKDASSKHQSTIASVLIMRELAAGKRRTTRLHKRGSFLDQGAEVQPAVLPLQGIASVETAVSAEGAGRIDRLAAARWLVSSGNPLTPRVLANRLWARLFNAGLVESEEDFGALGSLPSNSALLDWLARHYRDDCAWSLKRFLRTIVLSETYQQSVAVDDTVRQRDPTNRWLSRGARFRLSAEQVRDQALAISGLLSSKIGGRSVMPPQPDGLWRSTYNATAWVTAAGEDRYRRGLYTFWKRTTPYPSMTTFDASSGEICQVRRISTNTPLQALVTLNDPVYLEAAAALGARMRLASGDETARAERGLRLALIRPVAAAEVQAVVAMQRRALAAFTAAPAEALALLKAGNVTVVPTGDAPIQAAWMVAGSMILNLDELLTRN